ncbi:hypothetical protein FB45DRAFT_859229 [Roridomyces roridus]|uniref:Uncharacterized protein n=1 Tax=Roridomyces roridus TaxID=1738132 RepID=A0AAD7CJV8_9AGAR|nr:hypothetical protein FB45DRAFT_859229 [Roridomyces roridus]
MRKGSDRAKRKVLRFPSPRRNTFQLKGNAKNSEKVLFPSIRDGRNEPFEGVSVALLGSTHDSLPVRGISTCGIMKGEGYPEEGRKFVEIQLQQGMHRRTRNSSTGSEVHVRVHARYATQRSPDSGPCPIATEENDPMENQFRRRAEGNWQASKLGARKVSRFGFDSQPVCRSVAPVSCDQVKLACLSPFNTLNCLHTTRLQLRVAADARLELRLFISKEHRSSRLLEFERIHLRNDRSAFELPAVFRSLTLGGSESVHSGLILQLQPPVYPVLASSSIPRLVDYFIILENTAMSTTKFHEQKPSVAFGKNRVETARNSAASGPASGPSTRSGRREIIAAITRWGTRRLIQLQPALLDLVNRDDEDSMEKARKVIALIDSGGMGFFWTAVHRISRYLEPLAVTLNVTQGANTPLDHNFHSRRAQRGHLRQPKRDQDFYILVVFLNPYLRAFLLNEEIHSLSRIGLYHVLKRMYARVLKLDDALKIYKQKVALSEFKNIFKADTLVLMNAIRRGVKGELALLAAPILCTIANLGANKRAFSLLGRTYGDKIRNFSTQRTHKSLLVKRDIAKKFPDSKRRSR